MPHDDSTSPRYLTFYGRHWKKRRPRGEGAVPPGSPNAHRCPRCKVWRPDETFGKCKTCQSCRDAGKDYHLENKTERLQTDIARKHGMSYREYQELHALHGGKCSICGETEERRLLNGQPRLVVDHDHASGRVRGLLCYGCNSLVGFLETREWYVVECARAYLAQHAEPMSF